MATLEDYIYTDDFGVTHPIKLAPARATAGGFSSSGTPASSIPAEVSGQSAGLIPRRVALFRTIGVGELKKRKTSTLPIATKTALALLKKGGTKTIGGVTWTISKVHSEKYSPR